MPQGSSAAGSGLAQVRPARSPGAQGGRALRRGLLSAAAGLGSPGPQLVQENIPKDGAVAEGASLLGC